MGIAWLLPAPYFANRMVGRHRYLLLEDREINLLPPQSHQVIVRIQERVPVNGPINRKVLDRSRFGTTLFMLNIIPSNTARV